MKNILFMALLILSTVLFANISKDIQEIKDLYQMVGENINNDVYYINLLQINQNNLSFPAVGNYQPIYKFYWLYDGYDGSYKIVKVTIQVSVAAHDNYYELLFDESENLVFYLKTESGNNDYRYYYKDGKPIRFMENSDIYDDLSSEQISQMKEGIDYGRDIVKLFKMM